MESESQDLFTTKKDTKIVVQEDYIPQPEFDFADEDAVDWLNYINENKLASIA